MLTLCINAAFNRLIVHQFDNEQEARKTMPHIKNWERIDNVWKDKIRYHSRSANKYWRKRKLNDKVFATTIIYKDGKPVQYKYE